MKKSIVIYLLLQSLFVGVLKAQTGPPGDQVVTICMGSSKKLIGAAGQAGYQWYKDGQLYSTAEEIVVNTAGKYQLVLFSAKGCAGQLSDAVIIKVAPVPVASIASVVQPSCTVATGTITVTPIDSASYSIDGGKTFTASNIFNNLAPDNYSVVVQSVAGCTSAAVNQTINNQPPPPADPVVNIIQPNCTIGTGTITITPPAGVGATYTYSVDGTNYQSSNVFSGLAPGNYTAIIKNDLCVSNPVVVALDKQAPNGDFTASAVAIKYGSPVSFTANVPGAVTYLWTFGDGGSSTVANPQHYYYQAGAFDVTLTVTTSGGCDYTITKTGYINVTSDSYTPIPPVIVIPPPYTGPGQNGTGGAGTTIVFKSYPNPFHSYFYINFNSTISQTVQAELIDMVGNIVVSRSFNAKVGNNTFELTNFPYMAMGYYLLNVKALTINSETKILKN